MPLKSQVYLYKLINYTFNEYYSLELGNPDKVHNSYWHNLVKLLIFHWRSCSSQYNMVIDKMLHKILFNW